MPTGTIELLSMPCSLTSGEYPLLTSASQSLTPYLKKSYTGKYREDLRQSLTLPEFSGWTTVNMLRFGGRMWWVLDSRTSSDTSGAIRFEVSCCGPSSLLHKGDSIKGIYSRLPTRECPYRQFQPRSSSMKFSRSVELTGLQNFRGHTTFWVQITATADMIAKEYASATEIALEQGRTTRYGFFAAMTDDLQPVEVAGVAGGSKYPTIPDIINNIEDIGLTASVITDISISRRCPYVYGVGTSHISLIGLSPNVTIRNTLTSFYRLEGLDLSLYSASRTMTLTNLERDCGSVSICNEQGNGIVSVPTAWDSDVTVDCQCVSDYNSLTTRLSIGGYEYTLPEGHLPWTGSTWEEYRAYSLAFDRQAMEQSIQYANQRTRLGIAEAGANAISNVAMGAIGGNPLSIATGAISGAVSFGIQTWSAMEGQRIAEAESRATQALSERRVQAQPGTAYNSGYGVIYCWNAIKHPACIQLEMPSGLTQEIYDDYVEQFGYPAENARTYTIRKGFIQGRLLDNSLTRGRLFDSANSDLQRGIRFVEV